LRQERKTKKRAVGDYVATPERPKDAESSARSILFYAVRRFWKAEEREIFRKIFRNAEPFAAAPRFNGKKTEARIASNLRSSTCVNSPF
jgi:hypothetical protein